MAAEKEELLLPPVIDGEMATVMAVKVTGKKTKPPNPYTEGSLLGDMRGAAKFVEDDPELKRQLKEISGLGTAATRDSIIESLKVAGYCEKSGKYLVPTEKGIKFVGWLEAHYPNAVNVALTARWEAELSLVAKNGGGLAFEARVAEAVRQMIEIFKAAPSFGATTTKKESTMSDAPRAPGKPTEPMLRFAKQIADKLGIKPFPDEVMNDFDACKKFIDDNKDSASRPTEKQLNFANSIASKKGVTIPASVLANGRELSAWIDNNK